MENNYPILSEHWPEVKEKTEQDKHMEHVNTVMNQCRRTGLTPFQLLNTSYYTDKWRNEEERNP